METWIRDARLIDGQGHVTEHGDIWFDEQGIKGIYDRESGRELPGRPETSGEEQRVIDGRGLTVLPGFIDCHVHPAGLQAEDEQTVTLKTYNGAMALLRSGITTFRSVGTRFGADVTLRDLIGCGEIKGPRIKASGEALCITAGHVEEIGICCDTVGEAVKAARSQMRKRVDWLKLMCTGGVIGIGPATEFQLSREQIEAIIGVGRAFATPTCAHLLMNYEATKFCVEAGLTCVEHGYAIDETLAKLMVQHGTWYVPTAVVTLMEMTHIKPSNAREEELVEKAAAAQEKARIALRAAIKAGVRMAVGTDTGCPYTNPDTYAYMNELLLYEGAGMDRMEILNCATEKGAELLGISDITGSLTQGKCADITVIEGNPLEDLACVKDVRYTFCKGDLLYHTC